MNLENSQEKFTKNAIQKERERERDRAVKRYGKNIVKFQQASNRRSRNKENGKMLGKKYLKQLKDKIF